MTLKKNISRRKFIGQSLACAAGSLIVPTVVPASVFGRSAPSNKINIAQIGFGRIAMTHDLPLTLIHDITRLVAIADVDIKRAAEGKEWALNFYEEKTGKKNFVDISLYQDYHEMLLDPSIDAVIISTPDHWHAQLAIEAALEGKDIYLQKPASLTIKEGRQMSNIINRTGIIFQQGSSLRKHVNWLEMAGLEKSKLFMLASLVILRVLKNLRCQCLITWIMICGLDQPPMYIIPRTGYIHKLILPADPAG